METPYRNTYSCRLRWLAETPPDRAMPYKQREHRVSHVLDGGVFLVLILLADEF